MDVSYVPMRRAWVDDLELVHADQRPQDRQARRGVDGVDVLEGLARYLSQAVAGDESERPLLPGDHRRRADHETTVQDDPQGSGTLRHDPPLQLGERHHVESRPDPRGVNSPEELAHLVEALEAGVRMAVEVHVDRKRPALQQSVRGDRRVDTSGEKDGDATRHPRGQSAGPGGLAERDEGHLVHQLDLDLEVRVVEVDGPTRELLHAGADDALDIHGGVRQRLGRPLGANRERAGALGALEDGADRGLEALDSGLAGDGRHDVGDPEDSTERRFGLAPRGSRLQDHRNPSVETLHLCAADRFHGELQVLHEPILEGAAVVSLESDLVVVNQNVRRLQIGEWVGSRSFHLHGRWRFQVLSWPGPSRDPPTVSPPFLRIGAGLATRHWERRPPRRQASGDRPRENVALDR